jgi:hypothetical protein
LGLAAGFGQGTVRRRYLDSWLRNPSGRASIEKKPKTPGLGPAGRLPMRYSAHLLSSSFAPNRSKSNRSAVFIPLASMPYLGVWLRKNRIEQQGYLGWGVSAHRNFTGQAIKLFISYGFLHPFQVEKFKYAHS